VTAGFSAAGLLVYYAFARHRLQQKLQPAAETGAPPPVGARVAHRQMEMLSSFSQAIQLQLIQIQMIYSALLLTARLQLAIIIQTE